MWIKCWINAQMMSCIFVKVWWIFCMMCVEFRSALMHAAWMHDKTPGDGGDACRIFWGWLDAHVTTGLKVSKGSQIWIQPLEMHMAWNHKSICKIQRNVQIFRLMAAEQVHIYQCTHNDPLKYWSIKWTMQWNPGNPHPCLFPCFRSMHSARRICRTHSIYSLDKIEPSNGELPFQLYWRQFSVHLAFCMTINKSQGKSVKHLRLDVWTPVFTHEDNFM